MAVFELVVALLIAGALLSVLAERLAVPGPALLALAGAAIALLPGVPAVELDPQLALALFVAPILVKAGRDASLRDLRDHWVPVLALVVNLVFLTAVVVAVVAHALVPDLPWAAAFALGAVVAPPDASAATPVLRRLSPPHRAQVILEGESLLNDATALLLFRLAVVTAAGEMTPRAIPVFFVTTLAGVAVGGGLAWLFMRLRARAHDVPNVVMFQFLTTFAVWLLAERLQISAILTMVAFAIVYGRFAPRRLHPRQRILAAGVWDVAVHVLTVLAFILTGLQLKTILPRLDGQWDLYVGFAGAVCAAVIVVRLVWVLGWSSAVIAKNRVFGASLRRKGLAAPNFRVSLFIGWSGMRGVVTLATALALPVNFPHRDLLVFTAFAVVLVTLVLQGFTVGPLLRALRIESDGSVARETALARAETARAALACLREARASAGETSPTAAALRRDFEDRLQRAEASREEAIEAPELTALRQRILGVERAALDALRESDLIGDEAYRAVEDELDWSEVIATRRLDEG